MIALLFASLSALAAPKPIPTPTPPQFPTAPQARPGLYGSSENIKCPIAIDPDHSIGPIHIGDDLTALKKTNSKILQVSNDTFIVGRSWVTLDFNGKVMYIEAEIGDLPDCVTYKGKKIPHDTTRDKLAKTFEGCGKEDHREGGNLTFCKGVGIGTGGWGGSQKTPTIRIPR